MGSGGECKEAQVLREKQEGKVCRTYCLLKLDKWKGQQLWLDKQTSSGSSCQLASASKLGTWESLLRPKGATVKLTLVRGAL